MKHEYYIIIPIIAFAIGLWNLMIAILGLFPQCLATAVGTLRNAKTKKNVRTKHNTIIPVLTRYAYFYTVNGRDYKYSSEALYSKRQLYQKASMVYVKWFPWRAYPNKFKGTNEWVIGLIMLFLGFGALWAMG